MDIMGSLLQKQLICRKKKKIKASSPKMPEKSVGRSVDVEEPLSRKFVRNIAMWGSTQFLILVISPRLWTQD